MAPEWELVMRKTKPSLEAWHAHPCPQPPSLQRGERGGAGNEMGGQSRPCHGTSKRAPIGRRSESFGVGEPSMCGRVVTPSSMGTGAPVLGMPPALALGASSSGHSSVSVSMSFGI